MRYDPEIEERNSAIHRTLVEFLLHTNQPEIAAAILEGWVDTELQFNQGVAYFIEIPPEAYSLVAASEQVQTVLRSALREVLRGHWNVPDDLAVDFRMKRLNAPDEAWNKTMKAMISEFKGSNQGLISQIVAAREGRPVHTWNELRYASASEIRIAQELEKRQVLFFPLAVAVRAETGQRWKDHREVDFLVCDRGVWGILEVAYHPDRYEKDSEKDHWFKKSGILCIQHYTAERCNKEPSKVLDDFLGILTQFKK
jgi:hypothetical protein